MSDHAANIRRLRKNAKLTQAELAERANVPRATLANMERDGSNPGIDSVVAVAKALGIAVDELVTPPPEHRYYKVVLEDQQEYRAEGGRFLARLVSPITSKGVQVHHTTIMPNTRSVGRPHPMGAQEYFLTLSGLCQLEIDGEKVDIETGTLVQFPGHKKHVYINPDPIQVATAISIVVFQPG
jgi:XRE family transcriptional regulator, regulator of sulfur utilization